MLLLATTTGVLFRPGKADAHGWVSGSFSEVGPVEVSIQPLQEVGDLSAADSSTGFSEGPGAPGVSLSAEIYAAPSTDVRPGDRIVGGGQTWQIRAVVLVAGPVSNDLDVLRCSATAWNGDPK